MKIWEYYKILGVPGGAGEKEIKAAHRKLGALYNPEKPGGDIKKFTEVNNAYAFLMRWLPQEEKIRKSNPDEYAVRALLGITEEDDREKIKAKFGIFRLKYFKKEIDFTEQQMDKIGEVIGRIAPETELEKVKRELAELQDQNMEFLDSERKAFWVDVIVFLVFSTLAIPSMIFLWGIHPILGLLALGLFIWLVNNKWKFGYYL